MRRNLITLSGSAPHHNGDPTPQRMDPMHRTEVALMARGFDSALAKKLRIKGWGVTKLKQASRHTLAKLGIPPEMIKQLGNGSRPPIPFDVLVDVCSKNRWCCCVCRNAKLPIVVHHIKPWAESKDHSESNLAVVCPNHHSDAHTQRQLTLNLTAKMLRSHKKSWQAEVEQLDAESLKYLPMLEHIQWLYFNHQRLFELARELSVDLKSLPAYTIARKRSLITPSGEPTTPIPSNGYMYEGGDGRALYSYVSNVMENVWSGLQPVDVSDRLDRDDIRSLLWSKFIYVQGAVTFASLNLKSHVQAARATRSANGVRIVATIDRGEATSTSAWSEWLRGRHSVGLLLRVHSLVDSGGVSLIEGTAIGVCTPIDNLAKRRYDERLWSSGLMRKRYAEEE